MIRKQKKAYALLNFYFVEQQSGLRGALCIL